MNDNEKIDWEDLRQGFNRIYKTSYKTVTEMLTSLYAQEKTLVRAGKVLGPSSQTIRDKMKELNILRLPKGHRGKSKCIRDILSLGDVSQMSTFEIAKAIEFSRSYVIVCLQKEGIKYRRGIGSYGTKNDNEKIDWNSLLEDYNSVKSTNIKTPREMLKIVYAEKQTYKKTGKVFLLSTPTIRKYMNLWKLEHKPKGHRGKSKCIRAILDLGDVSQMTTLQIAKAVDFSRGYVTVCLQKEGILYRRGKG